MRPGGARGRWRRRRAGTGPGQCGGQRARRARRAASGRGPGPPRQHAGGGRPDRGRAPAPGLARRRPGRRRSAAGRRASGCELSAMHVVATAGHVDHGKSALIRALTGQEPDRWAEERRRGMTIDLGFGWLTMPSGEQLAFVDVPGHERFVPNMLAGAGPGPAVMFVVAADEGWMPQSAEHLAVVDALGIRSGLLVVTKSDLADPGAAIEQATEKIAASSLGLLPAVAVSAQTGAGLSELVVALDQLCKALPEPDPSAAVRIWVDRSFTMSGSGTVVTGTLPAGTVHRGDELMLAPSMRPVTVRELQSLGE